METTKEERRTWTPGSSAFDHETEWVLALCRDVDALQGMLGELLAGVKWESGTWAIRDLETFEASLLKARAVLDATPAATGQG